jgi:transcriptional regulator with XRE-family HTH domain
MPRRHPLDAALAARLVQRRQELRWSQNRLALAAGLSEGAVQKYETLRLPIPPYARVAMETALAAAEHDAVLASGRTD